jgi:hypothetical protein
MNGSHVAKILKVPCYHVTTKAAAFSIP